LFKSLRPPFETTVVSDVLEFSIRLAVESLSAPEEQCYTRVRRERRALPDADRDDPDRLKADSFETVATAASEALEPVEPPTTV